MSEQLDWLVVYAKFKLRRLVLGPWGVPHGRRASYRTRDLIRVIDKSNLPIDRKLKLVRRAAGWE